MTTILPQARSPWEVIDQAIGSELSKNLPGAVQQGYNRRQIQNSLGELKNIASSGGSPLDVTLAAMNAGAGIPGSERYLGQIIPLLQQMATANATQNAPLAGEQNAQRTQQRQQNPMESPVQRQQLPNFANAVKEQTAQTFPTNIGPQGGPGNIPQAATSGQKLPLSTPQELIPQAKELAAQRTKAGIPTNAKEALEELKEVEREKKSYNDQIDKELAQRVKGQQTYGERAVEYLRKVDPKAGDEVEAIFQKKGEEIARNGGSEADINRALAKEAEKYKIAIENVNEDLSAPRAYKFLRAVNGNYKNFNQAAEDLRKTMQPLIDMGLYNKARSLLEKKGYGTEETEMILHPLSDQGLSFIRQTPKLKIQIGKGPFGIAPPPKIDPNNIKSALQKVKNVDPNFSPVLARKAFEDLGYDWRSFKDAWNELLNEGFELTDDQRQMQGYLDEPPVNLLDSFLSGLNLTGR